jgi:hypothetical protein
MLLVPPRQRRQAHGEDRPVTTWKSPDADSLRAGRNRAAKQACDHQAAISSPQPIFPTFAMLRSNPILNPADWPPRPTNGQGTLLDRELLQMSSLEEQLLLYSNEIRLTDDLTFIEVRF